MDETPRKPVMAWQFMRRHFVRIVIAAVLAAAAYVAVSDYATYLRERRIAWEIELHGGGVRLQYAGPDGIPQSVQDRLPYLDRIHRVDQLKPSLPSDLLSEFG